MVVTQPISSLATKLLRSSAGQRFKRLSVSPLAISEHSSGYQATFQTALSTLSVFVMGAPCLGSVVEMGPLLGIVFAAFMMGICLMGGLWYIYNHTGDELWENYYFYYK